MDKTSSTMCRIPNSFTRLAFDRAGLILRDLISPVSAVRYLFESFAVKVRRSRRSILIQGETPEQFICAMHVIQTIMKDFHQIRLVLTSSDPRTVEWLRTGFVDVTVCPSPIDSDLVVKRLYRSISPVFIILLDPDQGLGPKASEAAASASVPLGVLNVALEEKVVAETLLSRLGKSRSNAYFCCKDRKSASLLIEMNVPVEKVAVTGGLDFEYTLPTENVSPERLRFSLGIDSKAPVIAAGKISPAEEPWLLNMFRELRRSQPKAVLLVEPQRTSQRRRLVRKGRNSGFRAISWNRSSDAAGKDADVIIFDSAGVLPTYYRIAVCVLAGGSFSNQGNSLKLCGPAVCGVPILLGPILGLDSATARLFLRRKAALQVSPLETGEKIDELIRVPSIARRLVQKAKNIIEGEKGVSHEICSALRELITDIPHEPPVAQSWHVKTLRDVVGHSAFWKGVAPFFMRKRIDQWESLRARLNYPKSVLCLGNGPSSEDCRLKNIEHDCLLRVNWRWKARGLLTKPDVVFVGDASTLHKLSSCIFGIWNIYLEYGMLLRYLVTHGPRLMEYFILERISSLIGDNPWSARPSNGALMIVAGVALQPERLVIAGVDLYRHPDGKYPDDFRSANQYSPVHRMEIDLEIIRRALDGYQGELLVLSDALQEALFGPVSAVQKKSQNVDWKGDGELRCIAEKGTAF